MTKTDFLLKKNTTLNDLLFYHTAQLCNNNINRIFESLMNANVDKNSLGFWIWDIPGNLELYSDKFRKSFGYDSRSDFPDIPESWQNIIEPKDLEMSLENFNKHVESKGGHSYTQTVTYNKKDGGRLTVICHGIIVHWKDQQPQIMIGVHLPVIHF